MFPPAGEGSRDIGEYLAVQIAAGVTFEPDLTLKRFQRSGLSILIHQPVHVGERRIRPGRWGQTFAHVLLVFAAKKSEVFADQVLAGVGARKREQDVIDERDRRA